MYSNPHKRFLQRGNSFTTCLLTLVVVFGGIGFYYFTYFQWRHFEAPLEGLNYTKDTDAPQRNMFRKKTIQSITDPLLQQIERVKKIRSKTKKGTVKYPEMEQDLAEVRNRLKELMTEARLRRIPTQFKDKYNKNLLSLQAIYRSTRSLEESFEQETDTAKKKLYNESVKLSNKASSLVNESRAYFNGDGWKSVE